MKKKIDLFQLIKQDKEALSNKEGLKPLFAFAESIANVGSESAKEDISREILNLNISALNAEETNTFLSFIYYSKISVEKILVYFFNYLKSERLNSDTNDDSLLKRALIIRFIVERNKNLISLRQILNESKLMEKTAWIMIDCISYLNWERSIIEISKQMGSNNDSNFKNLLVRIPSFEKRFGKQSLTEAFKKWHPNLNKSDRIKLDKWAFQFEIKFGPSVSAERLIESASFLQNQIMEK